jgi:hypothetical protein
LVKEKEKEKGIRKKIKRKRKKTKKNGFIYNKFWRCYENSYLEIFYEKK